LWAAVARANLAATSHLNPHVFHALNLILHLASVTLAYALLRQLVGRDWPAAVGALIFAIHPVQVEAVAWVSGAKDLLAGALSLAALWMYLLSVQSQSSSRSRRLFI